MSDCCVSQVGDREWWCATHRGNAEVCDQKNPLGIHTECGPLNVAGQPLHLHIWPMNAAHTKRWRPVEYVGRHRR